MGKPNMTHGGQSCLMSDVHRVRPRSYLHRHKLHTKNCNCAGPNELRPLWERMMPLFQSTETRVQQEAHSDRSPTSLVIISLPVMTCQLCLLARIWCHHDMPTRSASKGCATQVLMQVEDPCGQKKPCFSSDASYLLLEAASGWDVHSINHVPINIVLQFDARQWCQFQLNVWSNKGTWQRP